MGKGAISPKLFNTVQAAKRLGISDSLVRRLCRQKAFGAQIGKVWVITEAELRAFKPRPRGRPRKRGRKT